MTPAVCVNARFRHQRMTGVQRYAAEVLSRLPGSVESIEPEQESTAKGMLGHLWEQTSLALRVRGRVLWSPCNTGPLRVKRHVVTLHDTAFLDYPECFSPHFRRWYQWLIPRLIKSARLVLTVSQFSASRLMHHFGLAEQSIRVTPNGVDERFRPAWPHENERVRRQYQLPQAFALTLGSLDPRKNLQRMMQAWQSSRALADCPLVVAGGSSNVFANQFEKVVPPNVQFLGYVPEQDLAPLYSSASVFLYPSLYEGFGLPPLEAMACGTPTIVSATTALPEVVGEAGITVDPTNAECIADAVTHVLEDTGKRAELSRAGIERARLFNWDSTTEGVWNALTVVD